MMLGGPSGALPWTVLSRVFYGGLAMLLGSSLPMQRKTYDVFLGCSVAAGARGAQPLARDGRPCRHSSLAHYYARLDKLVGVFGNNYNLPNHPGGYFLPPPPPRCYELMVKDAADRLNITCVAARLSILTKDHNGRMACHYC